MSLFLKMSQTNYNSKIKKSFPEDKVFLCYFHVKKYREAPQCTSLAGSITVEAAVILPLFACFFSFILFYFQIMQVQISVQSALEQTGRILAVFAEKEENESIDDIKYLTAAKGILYAELKEERLIKQFVRGDALGVSLLDSEFGRDYILLKANYVMKFPVKLFGNMDFHISQTARFRKWTGWHVLSQISSEEFVYMTSHGTVWHLRKSCPYLSLSVRKVFKNELSFLRNASGGKYRECNLCKTKEAKEVIYVTDYGDKYHFSVTCSGLKRTIYQKKLSEVRGVSACGKCSK